MTKVVSRIAAITTAIAAVVVTAVAVISRLPSPEDELVTARPAGDRDAAVTLVARRAPVPSPAAGSGAAPSQPIAAIAAPPPGSTSASTLVSTPAPELGAITATVLTAPRGIDITLAIAIRVPPALPPRSAIWVRALCAVDGEWYDGTARVGLDDVGTGEHVVAHLVVGHDYRLTAAPSACHLAFQRDLTLSRGEAFAIRCWNGRAVVDGRCPAIVRTVDGKPLVALRGMKLRSDGDRWAPGGAPRYVSVEVEAELARAIDWRGRITADCKLADGSIGSDTGSFSLRYRPGQAFFATAMLFSRRTLPAPPRSCTLRFDIADDRDLASEPVAVRCWSNNAISPGACAP